MSEEGQPVPVGGLTTFLFTDVVGSTAAWEAEPGPMGAAMARHDELIERAVGDHGGHVVRPRGEGDSRFAVFDDAAAALGAAGVVERDLAAEDWPTSTPIRVRIAVHSGHADLRMGDYYGSAVNRCARLRSIAHPGQILASQVTVDLAGDVSAAGLAVVDLGVHWLKDLADPERVFQVNPPGTRPEFPPLTSAEPASRRFAPVPTPASLIVGRGDDVAAVIGRLLDPSVRLLTMVGPGGVGKTRLALAVAEELRHELPGGIAFVDLAAIEATGQVLPAIARAVGVQEATEDELIEAVVERLGTLPSLLLLDNVEQVLDAAPEVVELVDRSPALTVLCTSRVALRVAIEHEHVVTPLGLPDPAHLPPPARLGQYDAVALFVARCQAVAPGFAVTTANARAVAEICVRLDGLPLALELAAARARILEPADMLARLDRSLRLLVGGGRDLPDRQRTLRATLDWSIELLDAGDRALLARLGVFSGSFTLAAAEAICGEGDDDLDVLDGLGRLVDNSLVQAVDDSARLRFRLLQVVREHSLEQLAADSLTVLRSRHAQHMRHVAEAAGAGLDGPDGPVLVAELLADEPNLDSAMAHLLEDGQVEEAGRLAMALRPFWVNQGRLNEGRSWLRAVLAGGDLPVELRGRLRVTAGELAYYQDDRVEAGGLLVAGLDDTRSSSDHMGEAAALCLLGGMALAAGDEAEAERLASESLALSRRWDLYETLVLSLSLTAMLAAVTGDLDAERARYEERLALVRDRGDRGRTADTLNTLAEIALDEGEVDAARDLVAEALPLVRGATRLAAPDALLAAGRIALADRDAARAADAFTEAFELCVEFGQAYESAQCLRGLASALAAVGHHEAAARLDGAADRAGEVAGGGFPDKDDLVAHRVGLKAGLGDERYDRLLAEGAELDSGAVMALVQQARPAAGGGAA